MKRIAVSLCLAAAGCAPSDPVASGDAYAAKGQLREAVLEYRHALEQRPDLAETHYKLALAYERLADIEKAARSLARATQLDPSHVDARRRAALHMAELRRRDDVRRLTEVRGLLANSEGLLAAGHMDEAQAELERARSRGAAPADVDAQRARIALAMRDPITAIPLAERAARNAPSAAHEALLARALRADGELGRARRVLTAARQVHPVSADLEIELGHLEIASRRPADARRAVERAARAVAGTGPDAVALAILSARLDLAERQPDAAKRTLTDLVRRAPQNPDAAEALAELLAVTGDADGALARYEDVVALRPRTPRALVSLGVLKQQRGDAAGARDAYERALAIDARQPIAANNLAWLYADEGRLEEAERLAERAAGILRGSPQVADTLARIHRLKGQATATVGTGRE